MKSEAVCVCVHAPIVSADVVKNEIHLQTSDMLISWRHCEFGKLPFPVSVAVSIGLGVGSRLGHMM